VDKGVRRSLEFSLTLLWTSAEVFEQFSREGCQMKFSRPINREVDIDGNTFIVTVEETGVGFRLKGKRKTARVEWTKVLEIAEGEQGERASEFLGFAESRRSDQAEATGREQSPERVEQLFEPETTTDTNQADDTFSRTARAGETSET
jgi:hypothetical protein